MARSRPVYACSACDAQFPKWSGQCPGCGSWNGLVEQGPDGAAAGVGPVPLGSVDLTPFPSRSTGLPELDRVLGGGLVPGSVTLVGGEPGIGKSTLLLQALAAMGAAGATTLLVSAEESAPQVRLRAERLGALDPRLHVLAETSLPVVLSGASSLAPDIMVVDSIQSVADPECSSVPGSVSQVTACAAQLVSAAKAAGRSTILVGHVTKDGSLAGPRVLEHMVDTVLSFEGERHHQLRMLRAVKHRFGATGELGVFEMAEAGLVPIPDPGALFLADRHHNATGSVVVPVVDGHRPLLVEVQALVNPTVDKVPPRRSAQGIDAGRLGLVIAVLQARAQVRMDQLDVFASIAGGIKVTEPGADLALAVALASAVADEPVADDVVVLGEVGLAGEVRRVGRVERRLAEAARLGFKRALVPPGTSGVVPPGLKVREVATVAAALSALGLSGVARSRVA